MALRKAQVTPSLPVWAHDFQLPTHVLRGPSAPGSSRGENGVGSNATRDSTYATALGPVTLCCVLRQERWCPWIRPHVLPPLRTTQVSLDIATWSLGSKTTPPATAAVNPLMDASSCSWLKPDLEQGQQETPAGPGPVRALRLPSDLCLLWEWLGGVVR